MLIFMLIVTYFRTLIMHHIAPFLSFFSSAEHAPGPHSTSVNRHHDRANSVLVQYVILYLGNVFIKTLMNVDQIYCLLVKMKLNLRIGPNSNYNTKQF